MVVTVQFSRQGMAAMPMPGPVAESSFVRRLLQAHDDPAKQRLLTWLIKVDDARLQNFGLTRQDIAILRGIARR
jgi:hypothetical protein